MIRLIIIFRNIARLTAPNTIAAAKTKSIVSTVDENNIYITIRFDYIKEKAVKY
jgi:hypothetical protein